MRHLRRLVCLAVLVAEAAAQTDLPIYSIDTTGKMSTTGGTVQMTVGYFSSCDGMTVTASITSR